MAAVIGLARTADQADESEAFLPDGSELIAAQIKLATNFPESAGLQSVQIVFRGDTLSPGGLADTREIVDAVMADEALGGFVVPNELVLSPGHIVANLLAQGGDPAAVDLTSTPQAVVDQALAGARQNPDAVALMEIFDSLIATDSSGTTVGGLGIVTVSALGDPDGLYGAEIAIDEVVTGAALGSLDSARTITVSKSGQESDDSSQSSLVLLMGAAFLVIAALLALFYRQVSDVALSLGGLILTIVWALGYQGLLGPDGLGLIGAPSVLGTMVPVMMIGLCVDYGIQGTARYREALEDDADATKGIGEAVAALILPLGLAGGTTIISFLTNLFGDISGLGDFGVVAGAGVASGLIIFLTGVPAARVILDRRRQRKGVVLTTRRMDQAIPGAGALVERIGAATVRKPGAILGVTLVVTVIMGSLASGLDSSFNSNDFLPDGSETKDDILFLDEFIGGNSEPVTVLVESDLSSDRTIRNLVDFSDAIEDPLSRPEAVNSGVTQSIGVFFESLPPEVEIQINALTTGLENPLVIPREVVDESLDIMQASDPEGFGAVAVRTPGEDVDDFTILQFNALTGDAERTRQLFDDVDQLWFGDEDEVTAIANEIINLEVTDSLTESQGTSILLTIVAAAVVLLLFFWATEFRPMLAVLSVLPILLVLIWVPGTMVLLGYSYNVVTALITALSIGIGVDYTIHITHRFLEEREHRDSVQEAVSATMRTTGGALIGSALTTALGFAVLIFSPIPPMGQFGLLTAITVAYSLLAAIVVLPPMLVIWAAYHEWRRESFNSGSHHS